MSLIYHIATRADWEWARRDGEYRTSTIGKTLAEEGFIHASQAAQVAGVANMFYPGIPDDLLVLVIDTDRVRAEIRYEDVPEADTGLSCWHKPAGLSCWHKPAGLSCWHKPAGFPHIYGPLNTDAVLAVRPLPPGPDGGFAFTPDHMS